jgi:hypothetical protein
MMGISPRSNIRKRFRLPTALCLVTQPFTKIPRLRGHGRSQQEVRLGEAVVRDTENGDMRSGGHLPQNLVDRRNILLELASVVGSVSTDRSAEIYQNDQFDALLSRGLRTERFRSVSSRVADPFVSNDFSRCRTLPVVRVERRSLMSTTWILRRFS